MESLNVLNCSKEELARRYVLIKERLSGLRAGTCESLSPEKEAEYKEQELEKLETLFEIRFSESIKAYV